MTEIILHAIKEFDVDISQFHNDSTSLTFSGKYESLEKLYNGKKRIEIVHGYNKDHRPDLKQLVFTLTVSRDGAVPVHYKTYDGNVTDDKTHIQTWEALRRLTGRSDFTYVADSKLCTKEQMAFLSKEGGKFITVLPKTRSENSLFRKWIQKNNVAWQEIIRQPDHRHPYNGEHVYWGIESPIPSEEGFRIIWILSSQKRDQDIQARQEKIQKTILALDELKQRCGKMKLKTKDQIQRAIEAVLIENKSKKYFQWQLVTNEKKIYKQKGKGRPGPDTEYSKVIKPENSFVAFPDENVIQEEAATDGMFPLITNHSKEDLSIMEVLKKYKYQPYIEKKHEKYKTVFKAAPANLKTAYRIEALQFVNFLVLLLNAIIERELRKGMQREKIPSLPLYPEDRICRYPTGERILSIFSQQRKTEIKAKGKTIKTIVDPLNDLQLQVLKLMGVPVFRFK